MAREEEQGRTQIKPRLGLSLLAQISEKLLLWKAVKPGRAFFL